jgi:hypothetical protein
MTEQEVISFLATTFRSVWVLEVMLLLRRERVNAWGVGAIVRETRSSQMAVADSLEILKAAGFLVQENNRYRFWPTTPHLEAMAADIEALYAAKPVTVIKAILTAPDEKLRTFSDAFKLKD